MTEHKQPEVLNSTKCDLLWRNREQVATDIRLISDSIHTNSVGYYGQWYNQLDQYFQFVKDMLLEEVY